MRSLRRLTMFTLAAHAAMAAALAGCTQNLQTYLHDDDKLGYSRACATLAGEHFGDVKAGRYFPPRFDALRWPGGAAPAGGVGEEAVVAALTQGKSKLAMVEARGGLGKTRLAKALHANTCKSLPVFTVDLNKDVAQAGAASGGNPIIRVIAQQLGLKNDVEGLQRLDELLHSHAWILLADAIEEVELLERPKVSIWLTKLRQAYPNTARVVIFSRPAVMVPYYGFDDVDMHVRLQLIDCERASKVIDVFTKSPEENKKFRAFLKRFGLDLQRTLDGRCIHPFLATYRDINALRKMALDTVAAGIGSYAAAHEALVALRMAKELERMNWGQREALDMLDRMTRQFRESQGTGAPLFDIGGCIKSIDPDYGWTAVDAGVSGNPAQRRRQVCEKALQSVVFEKVGDGYADEGRWRFFDDRTAALFRARWLNAELSRAAPGDCKPVTGAAEMLQDSEVARFAAGQTLVQRCFGPMLQTLCPSGAAQAKGLDAVIEGLPEESKRFQMLEEARTWAAENGKPACVVQSLDVVARSMGR